MFIIRKHLRPTSFISPLARYLEKDTLPCASKSLSTTSTNRTEDVDADIQENPFYEKYKNKIAKAKDCTSETPNKYSRVLHRESQSWKKNIENLEKRFTEKRKDEGKISGLKLPANLDSLIKMELFLDQTSDEISKLWTDYWSAKETVCAVVTDDVFVAMAPRIQECPMFLYPLPRDQGYEFYIAQFNDLHCFCTSLINYQVHGEDAPWEVCFKFYPELKESKGIVLMTSEFDASKLSILEVQYLAQLQQLFYAKPTEKRYDLMRTFNHIPDNFKFMDVVKEIESGDFIVRK